MKGDTLEYSDLEEAYRFNFMNKEKSYFILTMIKKWVSSPKRQNFLAAAAFENLWRLHYEHNMTSLQSLPY